MNRKKAIEILKTQKQKLDNPNFLKDENWVFQTASYIKDFFGESSTEYAFISKFEFTAYYSNLDSKQEAIGRLNAKTPKAKKYLENCIETISNKGLYKHPKKNLVSDKSNFELIGIVIAISIFVFGIGYWTKNIELISAQRQKEESTSLSSDRTTNEISNPKKKPTESSKNEPK